MTTDSPIRNKISFFNQKKACEAVLYYDRINVSVWAGIFHASLFKNIKFPKGRIFEDTYIFCDIIDQVDCYVYGDKPQYHYVQRNDSIVNQQFKEKNLEYIDSVKRLTNYIMKKYPDLERGCHRRMTHSYLSVLRYMEKVDDKYISLRNKLRKNALLYSKELNTDSKTPLRDKMALNLLKVGFWPYYKGWSLYSVLRK